MQNNGSPSRNELVNRVLEEKESDHATEQLRCEAQQELLAEQQMDDDGCPNPQITRPDLDLHSLLECERVGFSHYQSESYCDLEVAPCEAGEGHEAEGERYKVASPRFEQLVRNGHASLLQAACFVRKLAALIF